MSVEMDLAFEKYCKVDHSPTTVLPSPRIGKHENRNRKGKGRPSLRNNEESLESGFREIRLRNYHRSISCKSLPTRNNELLVDSAVLKRGSVYQCSRERQSFQRRDSVVGRKKIEVSLNGDAPFSFSLLDSICGSDEERESVSVKLDNKESAERDRMENLEFESHPVASPSSNANFLKEENQVFRKSLASRLAFPGSPAHSSDSYDSKGSPKSMSRFMPFRKSKSKPRQSSMNTKLESFEITEKKELGEIAPTSLTTHLHGDLKLQYKHGAPYFELESSHSDDIFVAKAWKAEDALNWVYTFHMIQGRKRSNANYSNKGSPIIGQMQVSTHISSGLSTSIMTEFVLYDIMYARKSTAAEQSRTLPDAFGLDFSSPYPWALADLHPVLESAAVVIEVPFEKRGSLKNKGSNKSGSTRVNVITPMGNHTLPDSESGGPLLPLLDRWRIGGGCDCGGWDMACPVVVLASPSNACKADDLLLHDDQPFELRVQGAREKDPALAIQITRKGHYAINFHPQLSTLQAFAITVAMLHTTETSATANDEHTGAREKDPALAIQITRKGHYAINFHPQLSTLQAFAITVAMLHTTETSATANDEHTVQCSFPRAFVEVVYDQTGFKDRKVEKTAEDHPSSFTLNPPFSPISRV